MKININSILKKYINNFSIELIFNSIGSYLEWL